VFADLKTNTRRRARQKKYDVNGTGGGSAKVKPLTDIEERILNILVIDGAPSVPEPGLNISVDRIEGIQRYYNTKIYY
jgi:hypothetical protein